MALLSARKATVFSRDLTLLMEYVIRELQRDSGSTIDSQDPKEIFVSLFIFLIMCRNKLSFLISWMT